MHSCSDAFYLSMETMVTIGYGVPDQYYNECVSGIFIVTSQSLLGRVLDAVIMVRASRLGKCKASSSVQVSMQW
jgi:hypothetical protein